MKEDSTKDDVEKKQAHKTDRLKLAPGVEPSTNVLEKSAGEKALVTADKADFERRKADFERRKAAFESLTLTMKERKEASAMRRKERPNADVVTKPASRTDRQELVSGVETSEVITPSHNAVAADAAKQASASSGSKRPSSRQDEYDSSSVASSRSSARPGAFRVGDTESIHDELTLQTREEPDLPIAGLLPDDESENNQTIAKAQILETAKVCGQPRWLIFAFLGVVLTGAIGVGLGVALSNDPPLTSPAPFAPDPTRAPSPTPAPIAPDSDRRVELEKVLSAEIPLLEFGASQIEVLNWLANEDPAMLNFETTPFRTILERYVIVTFYYSLNGPDWGDQLGFLSEESVCKWSLLNATYATGVLCDPMVVAIVFEINALRGQLPTELGLLTDLKYLYLRKFATVSELHTTSLLEYDSQFISTVI
jgi:hypothetical protein